MSERPPNILMICTDQHRRRAAGCYGHPLVRTPNLDRLAQQGLLFERAYCNTPICGPSRISFMTGRHLHDIGLWCNGVPWNGAAPTWAQRLTQAGYRTVSRGKMDVPGPHGSVGFADFHEPIPRRACDPWPLRERRVFDDPDFHSDGFMDWPRAGASREDRLAAHGLSASELHVTDEAGAYRTGYYDHDCLTLQEALEALRSGAGRGPWAMHVGLLQPHWPFICPQEFLDLYPPENLDLPGDFRRPNESLPPTLRHYQATQNDFRAIDGESHLRRIIAAYYGMVTCIDRMVGELLAELERQGIADRTYVIYTSDHGEALGEHGLFDKLTPYEDSIAVPLIIRGPGIAPGRTRLPVSLVDLYPTIMAWAGVSPREECGDMPGRSLPDIVTSHASRPILSQYHGIFLGDSWYMLLEGDYKYVHWVGRRPSLFDLARDPGELHDLGGQPHAQPILRRMEAALRGMVDIDAVAARAAGELAKTRTTL